MRNFVVILLVAISGACFGHLQAQTLTLSMPDTTVAPGKTIDIPISCQGFDEIVSMQFSLSWDTSVISYQTSSKGGLDNVAVGDFMADSGELRVSWFDVEGQGQSLDDGTIITYLRFLVRGAEGSSSPIDFVDMPLQIQVYRTGENVGEFIEVEFDPVNGLVTVASIPNISVSENITQISCAGAADGSVDLSILSNDEFSISWTGPDFSSSASSINSLAPGTYDLIINSSGEDVLYESSITISEPDPLTVSNLSTQAAECTSGLGSATVNLTGGTAPYTYDIGNGPVNSGQFNDLNPGAYALVLTDANGCTTNTNFAIEGPEIPEVDLGPDRTICPGETTTLTPGTFETYNWSTGSASSVIAFDQPGVYSVTVTTAEGCQGSDEIEVNISNDLPEVDLGPAIQLCPGALTTLDAGVYNSYSWSTGENTQRIEVSEAGTYQLTVTNASGCEGSGSIQVETNGAIDAPDLGPDQVICPDQTITITAGTYTSYSWSTGASTQSIEVNEPGTYQLTVTNASGCEGISSIQVEAAGDITPPDLGPDQKICPGQTLILDGGNYVSYSWSNGASTQSIEVNQPDTYQLTVTNASGCEVSSSVDISFEEEQVQLELGADAQICPGESLTLSPGAFSSYNWSTGSSASSIQVDEPGTYALTVTNARGCEDSDVIEITSGEEVRLLVDNDFLDLCPGDSIQLLISGAETYSWIDTSNSLSAVDIANPYASPDTTAAYTVVGSSACGSDTVNLEVFVYEVMAMAGPDTCIGPGDEAQLMAFGGVSYFWEDSRYPVSNPNNAMPTASPEDSTAYVVAITDFQGCTVRDTMVVLVANNPEDAITAVNMITPNGDEKNDVLYFSNIAKFGQNSLKIFNRWGNIVYQKVNYQSDDERFDGTYNGQELPAGTYYYMLSFRTGDIKQKLTILR